MFDYFYGQSGEMFSYFRVPKILFRDIKFKDLSTDAKTLYGILLDRMGLSVKNGWLDEQGRVYTTCGSVLPCSISANLRRGWRAAMPPWNRSL